MGSSLDDTKFSESIENYIHELETSPLPGANDPANGTDATENKVFNAAVQSLEFLKDKIHPGQINVNTTALLLGTIGQKMAGLFKRKESCYK